MGNFVQTVIWKRKMKKAIPILNMIYLKLIFDFDKRQ
jgi:hypothetical protein